MIAARVGPVTPLSLSHHIGRTPPNLLKRVGSHGYSSFDRVFSSLGPLATLVLCSQVKEFYAAKA